MAQQQALAAESRVQCTRVSDGLYSMKEALRADMRRPPEPHPPCGSRPSGNRFGMDSRIRRSAGSKSPCRRPGLGVVLGRMIMSHAFRRIAGRASTRSTGEHRVGFDVHIHRRCRVAAGEDRTASPLPYPLRRMHHLGAGHAWYPHQVFQLLLNRQGILIFAKPVRNFPRNA